jgi:hypothetical protein
LLSAISTSLQPAEGEEVAPFDFVVVAVGGDHELAPIRAYDSATKTGEGLSSNVPFGATVPGAFFLDSVNTAWMASNHEECARRATEQLHDVVEDLRSLLTAAVAAELQARRVGRDTEREGGPSGRAPRAL